jgi:hypothetical protein
LKLEGKVSSSKSKSLLVAEVSIEQFFRRNLDVYFWTFTEPGRPKGEAMWTKDEAEERFKPFRDLCGRRGVELLVVWELQERGSWHPHCLLNHYFDVVWLRRWMMKRGWGQQMRAEHYYGWRRGVDGCPGGVREAIARVQGYLVKRLKGYLTKGVVEGGTLHKKKFGASGAGVKVGNTSFKWAPWVKPGAYLYAWGVELFRQLEGRFPRWEDMGRVIRLGVEESGWAEVDPWWNFSVPG